LAELLEVRGLTKQFGGLAAVKDVDFNVHQGEILGIIGPNGAGKSTVFNMIGGTFPPTNGTVVFRGENITGKPAYKIAGRGITRLYQGNVLFLDSTVIQNVIIGLHLHTNLSRFGFLFGSPGARRREKELYNEAMDILKYVGLDGSANELAKSQPHGKQRLLGLAIAIASKPTILLLDEPVTGMNAEEVTNMVNMIKLLRDTRGITCIVVEHNMKVVMNLCDRIVTLSYGKKICDGTPKETAENPAVCEAYLGVENAA
jgi:branched-chain amino acid transport system ATP-binding protein